MNYSAGQTAVVVEGQTVTVALPVSGDPIPMIEWTLPDGTVLRRGESRGRSSVGDEGSLTISEVRLADSGSYRATASSSMGTDSVATPIRVVGKRLYSNVLATANLLHIYQVLPSPRSL